LQEGEVFLRKVLFLVFVLVLLVSAFVSGQDIVIGQKTSLYSKILAEERQLWISLPPDYHKKQKRYPVFYILDGANHFNHVTGLVRFLETNDKIPEMIIVGIVSTDRNRDFTPQLIKNEYHHYPTSGGADKFCDFLSKELFPAIETKYSTENYRLVLGHSFGGLFLTHVLLSRPEMFNAYLLASPNLHWIKQARLEGASDYLSGIKTTKRYAYITISKDEGITEPLKKLLESLEDGQQQKCKWHFELLEKDGHGTGAHRTVHSGLEYVFEGWSLHYTKLLEKGADAVREHYKKLEAEFGFELKPDLQWIKMYAQWLKENGKVELSEGMFDLAKELYPEYSRDK
jgi:predicted alpha/beta superfamily hydrolase